MIAERLELASTAELIDSVSGLLWAALAVIAAIFVLPVLKRVLESRDFTIEIAGMKLNAQQASDELSRQVEDLQAQLAEVQENLEDCCPEPGVGQRGERITADVERAPARHAPPGFPWPRGRPRILWADDDPEGNAFEIRGLTSQGWEIITARSTERALELLGQGDYDVVITDLGRVEEGSYSAGAGEELFHGVRRSGFTGPVIAYTNSSRAAAEAARLTSEGFSAVTASPVTLRRELEHLLTLSFEGAVRMSLLRHGFREESHPRLDFFGSIGSRRVAVEAVRVSTGTRLSQVRTAAVRLEFAARELGADLVAIVTPHPVEPSTVALDQIQIPILELKAFESLLADPT